MSARFKVLLASTAATLVFSATALGYTPQPHTFALQATIGPTPACVFTGQVVTIPIVEKNIGTTAVTARVSTDPMGGGAYQFSFVSARPTMNSTTTSYNDPSGTGYSYTVYSWQKKHLKPGRSAAFAITVKVPDWNIPSPPFTDPSTGQVYYPPSPQPYPTYFSLSSEVGGEPGSGQSVGLRFTYCGLPVPPLSDGLGK
jgi:hypothetical protein